MSLFPFLQLQSVEPDQDGSDLDITIDDSITLEERPDEAALDAFWQHVSEDVRADPEWFQFADDE